MAALQLGQLSLRCRTSTPSSLQVEACGNRVHVKSVVVAASLETDDKLSVAVKTERSTPEESRVPFPPSSDSELRKDGDGVRSVGDAAEGAELADVGASAGVPLMGLLVVLAFLSISVGGYVFRDQLNDVIDFFTKYIEDAGPSGYLVFLLGYSALEVLAIPALPLTMSAGLLFGPVVGTILCSLAGVISATAAFLISRYVARERIEQLVLGNEKYAAIDRAISENSFKVVTLLRLSPLLPFSIGNYVYGLTSVKLAPYVLGSWIGMLPGTWAYVSAGALGRSLLEASEDGSMVSESSVLALAAGLGVTALAATYVTRLADEAVKEIKTK